MKKIALLMVFMMVFTFSYSFSDSDDTDNSDVVSSASQTDDEWNEESEKEYDEEDVLESQLDELEEEIELIEDTIDYLEDVLEDFEDLDSDADSLDDGTDDEFKDDDEMDDEDDDDIDDDDDEDDMDDEDDDDIDDDDDEDDMDDDDEDEMDNEDDEDEMDNEDDDDMDDVLVNVEGLSAEEVEALLVDYEMQLETLEEAYEAKKSSFDKVLDSEKSELEILKDQLEEAKDELEDELEALEDEIEDLKESGEDTSALEAEYQEKLEAFNAKKAEMKATILERRSLVIKKYRAKELKKIEEARKRLEALSTMEETLKVLPVESVLSKGIDFKFDTPPVIKGDRTVVPIRAITEGFGADVNWDNETRTVTIQKGDIEISMPIDSFEVKVNGETVELDVQSEIMNSRTYVPLRFIVETFGLKIDWDSETETIEIEQ